MALYCFAPDDMSHACMSLLTGEGGLREHLETGTWAARVRSRDCGLGVATSMALSGKRWASPLCMACEGRCNAAGTFSSANNSGTGGGGGGGGG